MKGWQRILLSTLIFLAVMLGGWAIGLRPSLAEMVLLIVAIRVSDLVNEIHK